MASIFDAFQLKPADLRAAGIVEAMFKATGDDAYYTPGIPRNGILSFLPRHSVDTILRPITWGSLVECKFSSMQAGLTEIKVLDNLINNQPVAQRLQLTDGRYFVTSDLGMQWRLVSDGDFSDCRFIEFIMSSAFKEGELNALLTGSPPALGTPNVLDKLYALTQSVVREDVVANGLAQVELRALGETTYANLGDFNTGKYVIECLGPFGGGGRLRPRTHTIKFGVDIDGLQTAQTETDLVPLINTKFVDWKLTHMDGLVLSLPGTRVGSPAQFTSEGNVDAHGYLRLRVEGSITIPFTDWDSYWTQP